MVKCGGMKIDSLGIFQRCPGSEGGKATVRLSMASLSSCRHIKAPKSSPTRREIKMKN